MANIFIKGKKVVAILNSSERGKEIIKNAPKMTDEEFLKELDKFFGGNSVPGWTEKDEKEYLEKNGYKDASEIPPWEKDDDFSDDPYDRPKESILFDEDGDGDVSFNSEEEMNNALSKSGFHKDSFNSADKNKEEKEKKTVDNNKEEKVKKAIDLIKKATDRASLEKIYMNLPYEIMRSSKVYMVTDEMYEKFKEEPNDEITKQLKKEKTFSDALSEFTGLRDTVNHKYKVYFTDTSKSASLFRHMNNNGSLTDEEKKVIEQTDKDLKNHPTKKDYVVYRAVPKNSKQGNEYIHASLSKEKIKLEARHNLENYDIQTIFVPKGTGMISTNNFTEMEVILPRNSKLDKTNNSGDNFYVLKGNK